MTKMKKGGTAAEAGTLRTAPKARGGAVRGRRREGAASVGAEEEGRRADEGVEAVTEAWNVFGLRAAHAEVASLNAPTTGEET